jgi:hypothetical protein
MICAKALAVGPGKEFLTVCWSRRFRESLYATYVAANSLALASEMLVIASMRDGINTKEERRGKKANWQYRGHL